MQRRTYLVAFATTTIPGCLGDRSAAAGDTAVPDGGVRSTVAPPSSTVLTFQQWHRTTPVNVMVTSLPTTNQLRDDAAMPTDALPDGTKLVLVSGLLENATDESVALTDAGVAFGVVASDQLFEPVTDSEGEFSAAIEAQADASGTYLAGADARIDPGAQRPVWQAVLVPGDVSTINIQVAMCGGADCGVRWEPSAKTCNCPG